MHAPCELFKFVSIKRFQKSLSTKKLFWNFIFFFHFSIISFCNIFFSWCGMQSETIHLLCKIALYTLLNIRHFLQSFNPALHFSLMKHILLLSILILQAKTNDRKF